MDVATGAGVRSDLDHADKSTIFEDDNDKTGELEDQNRNEHNHYISAVILDKTFVPEDHENGFDGETKVDSIAVSSILTSADSNGLSSRAGEQEQTVSAPRISVIASPTAALGQSLARHWLPPRRSQKHHLGKPPRCSRI